jgi:DtxR family transcriptional regulator, Mn-dependent transcriptional regulator
MPASDPLPSLSSAMEDYLEVIYHLEQERRIARVRDIADKLGVKMSSVTSALKTLGSRGLIQYDPHQYIMLTEQGLEKARQIVRKHDILKRFLVSFLQIEESAAEDNACRIEHHLDPEVIDKLVRFLEFVSVCPVDQTKWVTALSGGCSDCLPCLNEARDKILKQIAVDDAAQP